MRILNEPIRILQVGMSPYYGGTEAFIMEQYRYIDKSKVQFDFLNVFSENIACMDEIKALGGRIFKLDMTRHNGINAYHENLNNFFKKNHQEFDGIHCNCQSLINTDLLKYAKKYHIPIRIVHAHNAGYGQEPTLLQKAIILMNKLSVKNYATHFFACSTLAAEWMFPKNTKATVIHDAIDTKKFCYSEKTRNEKRKDLKTTDDTLVLLFVGRLDPQKNPLFLIEIFENVVRKNENSLLLIAGDGYMREEIKSLIYEKGLDNKVRLLGNRRDVNELMQAADAFLLPSRFEGLGIVLIEAQAAGLPCFTSKDVVPNEVNITNNVHFISLKDSPSNWADCLLSNATPLQKRQDTSLVISEGGYSIEDSVRALERVYFENLAPKFKNGEV